MVKIEELVEKAYKNNKTIETSDILDLELTDDEYVEVISALNLRGINIEEETYEQDDSELDKSVLSNDFKLYLKDIGNRPLLSADEEKELFIKYQETRDPKIREKIIVSNLRLVISVANRYKSRLDNNTNDLLDLIQEGNAGLIKAVEKFDISFGNKFSTYAVWWIRSAIEKSLDDKGRTIRVPLTVTHAYNKIQKQKKEAELRGESNLNEYEIARSLGINEEKAAEIIEAGSRVVVSANSRISEEDAAEIIDCIADPVPLLEEEIIVKADFEFIEKIMRNTLTKVEFFVVCSKLGIVNEVNDCPECKRLREVGEVLGVTRERVRQILFRAYKKIRTQYKIQSQIKKNINNIQEDKQKTYTRW